MAMAAVNGYSNNEIQENIAGRILPPWPMRKPSPAKHSVIYEEFTLDSLKNSKFWIRVS